MTFSKARWVLVLSVAAAVRFGTACDSPASESGGDSSSHWLRLCRSHAECGNLACLCGACTKPCQKSADCVLGSSHAVCGAPASDGCTDAPLLCRSSGTETRDAAPTDARFPFDVPPHDANTDAFAQLPRACKEFSVEYLDADAAHYPSASVRIPSECCGLLPDGCVAGDDPNRALRMAALLSGNQCHATALPVFDDRGCITSLSLTVSYMPATDEFMRLLAELVGTRRFPCALGKDATIHWGSCTN